MPEEVVAPVRAGSRLEPNRLVDRFHPHLGQAKWPEGEFRVTREGRGSAGLAGLTLAAAIILGGAALASTYGPHLSFDSAIVGVGDALSVLAPFPVAFALGVFFPRWVGLGVVLWMAVTFELNQGYVNPFVLVFTLGPWVAGVMVRDRRRLAQQLAERARQLEAEGELLAEESVRYERTRIARELHDIVAHCVSVMVVQAYAGERLAAKGDDSASEAFGHIVDAAAQAQLEMRRLVDLLAAEPSAGSERGLAAGVGELVAGAVATGLSVNLRVHGDADRLPSPIAQVAYRVIQEGITNALKHAPGASIDIVVDCAINSVHIEVVNATATGPIGSPLQTGGGGHGLAGMRDRVNVLGGDFFAGPQQDSSWRVSVRLPITGTVHS